MQNIIWKRPDGGISVTWVFDGDSASEAERLKKTGDVPSDWENVAFDADVPDDRAFRGAWAHDGDQVVIDMPRAREIHKDRIRAMREPLLEALDVEFMRAVEAGDDAKKAEVAAKKQALRDATAHPGIEAAATPEELKAVIPDALRDNRE